MLCNHAVGSGNFSGVVCHNDYQKREMLSIISCGIGFEVVSRQGLFTSFQVDNPDEYSVRGNYVTHNILPVPVLVSVSPDNSGLLTVSPWRF
jgi:hypothetical protein